MVYPLLSGSVFDKLQTEGTRMTLPSQARVKIALDAASGLAHIHSCGIVHRDLKTANILLDCEGIARVTDFGLGRKMDHEVTNTAAVGTFGYIDPAYQETEELTMASDIFSLGSVVACLLKGSQNPIQARMGAKRIVDFNMHRDDFDRFANWSQEDALKVAHIVVRCCDRNPEERPSATDVVNDLYEVLGASGASGASGANGSGLLASDVAAGEVSGSAGASRLCKVCWDKAIDTVLLPCNHSVACWDCCQMLDDCPVCRRGIASVVIGNFANTYVR